MNTSPTDGGNEAFAYRIIHLPHDDAGISKYIEQYKTFRLLSLQLAPEAFSSTYAREIAFDDETWRVRLSHPLAHTFMAVTDPGQIVSVSSTLGPLQYGPDSIPAASNPWAAVEGQKIPGVDDPSHFRLNAVFTLAEARRKGISKALIERSIAYTKGEARAGTGRGVVFSVVVEIENRAAKALYESVGFVEVKRLGAPESGIGRGIVLLAYQPS